MGSMRVVVVAVLCAFGLHAGFSVTNAQLSPTFCWALWRLDLS